MEASDYDYDIDEKPTIEDVKKGNAKYCEGCKTLEFVELLKNHPSGYYCLDCWEAHYG